MSDGELKDIGTPLELINKKDSILFSLIESLDQNETRELIQIATEAENRKNENKN